MPLLVPARVSLLGAYRSLCSRSRPHLSLDVVAVARPNGALSFREKRALLKAPLREYDPPQIIPGWCWFLGVTEWRLFVSSSRWRPGSRLLEKRRPHDTADVRVLVVLGGVGRGVGAVRAHCRRRFCLSGCWCHGLEAEAVEPREQSSCLNSNIPKARSPKSATPKVKVRIT